MIVTSDPAEIKTRGKVGFVPTMGALHEGHASLIEESINNTDSTVVSIYVNPKQFDNPDDLKNYPRDIEGDLDRLRELGVECVFMPEDTIMYPDDFSTYVEETELSKVLCGQHRPGHFRGVTTVVTRLLNMVRPNVLFLGQKDIQQCLVLRRMVRNLLLPVEVKICPTVREFDGLALSSRNARLTQDDRSIVPHIYSSLQHGQALIRDGEMDPAVIVNACHELLEEYFEVQYLEILSYPDLRLFQRIEGAYIIATAVQVGQVRLIDNVMGGF